MIAIGLQVYLQVFVQVDGSNVTLEWNEPIYDKGDDILKQYCLYSLVRKFKVLLILSFILTSHMFTIRYVIFSLT